MIKFNAEPWSTALYTGLNEALDYGGIVPSWNETDMDDLRELDFLGFEDWVDIIIARHVWVLSFSNSQTSTTINRNNHINPLWCKLITLL